MAKYHPVSPNIWDRKFREVGQESPEAQVVYLYLITCRHRGSEGIFSLSKGYISIDTGLLPDAVDEALDVLTRAGYISYDSDNDVVLDRHALRYYKPVGDPQTTGALNRLEQVPNSPLKKELVKLAFISAPDFADAIIEAFPQLAVDTPSIESRDCLDTASRARARAPRGEESEKSRGSDSDFGSGSSDLDTQKGSKNWRRSPFSKPLDAPSEAPSSWGTAR